MREILFRGKGTHSGEWVEGNLFIPDREDTPTEICIGTNIVRITYDVVPETVGQYTGFTDKNGKKIFEGDIVSITALGNDHRQKGARTIAFIEYYKGDAGLCVYGGSLGVTLSSILNDHIVEVIGNIFDNLELLKGGVDK